MPVHGEFTEAAISQNLCQRWHGRRHSWTPTSQGGFDPRSFVVAPISDDLGKAYVLRHHYSGTYPASSRHRYGLYITGADTPTADAEGLDLVGVAIFGIPVQAKVLSGPLPDLEPFRQTPVM